MCTEFPLLNVTKTRLKWGSSSESFKLGLNAVGRSSLLMNSQSRGSYNSDGRKLSLQLLQIYVCENYKNNKDII